MQNLRLLPGGVGRDLGFPLGINVYMNVPKSFFFKFQADSLMKYIKTRNNIFTLFLEN